MNNFLIDTQVFIWWMEENNKLPNDVKAIIDDSQSNIFLSVVTPWEIVIKIKSGKLKVPKKFAEFITDDIFKVLPIQINHVLTIGKLPLHHKDPFDRVLISQALVENLTLITSDAKIWKYKLKLIKA